LDDNPTSEVSQNQTQPLPYRSNVSIALSLAIRGGYLACWLFALSTLSLVLCSREARAQESDFDREDYYRAVKYCRQNTLLGLGPMTLSPDRQTLCFDGVIVPNMHVSLAKDLKENGLFVVRSSGGHSATAIALSDLIRDCHATVVVYEYCASACAVFFLIAWYQTYVLKGALVVWHNPGEVAALPSSRPRRDQSRSAARIWLAGMEGRSRLLGRSPEG